MSLIKFNQSPIFPTFSHLFDNLFSNELDNWRNFSATNTTVPAVNIKEEANAFWIEVAAPGMEKTDFKVSLDKNLLTIASEKQVENKEETDKYSRREFSYCSFQRSFTLPESVNSANIEAKYENGVLKICVPKKEEQLQPTPKQIAIA